MSTETELTQKRQEVREEILTLKESIPSALIFNTLGRAFEPKSPGYWLTSIVLLNLILLSPWALIGLALGEVQRGVPYFIAGIIGTEGPLIVAVLAHLAVQNILDNIANRVIDNISGVDDLSRFLLWFKHSWSRQNVAATILPFSLTWIILGMIAISIPYHQFAGFGFSVTVVFVGLLVGITSHNYVWTCLLISNLKIHQYDMNTFSPADSEIISNISEMLTNAIYILAAAGAIMTLLSTSSLIEQESTTILSLPFVAITWIVIIIQFLLTRNTLGTITDRAKWKTLNRIRDKINVLEATGDLSDKDTAERLFRLADIHKQIMASNTKTFDLKSVSTLFSQLMLPLLGLLLGNLDKVLELLQK